MAAEQAKDRGNKAFLAGNYREAISSFTEAIALQDRAVANGETSVNVHVYYSNRSASYLKLGDGINALDDADKCIAVKKDWSKGYSRKGAALHHLNRFTDAYRVYQEGLKLDPSNAALQAGLQSVQSQISASSSTTVRPPTASSASSAGAKTLRQFVAKDKSSLFYGFQFILRSLLLLMFISYWFPLVLSYDVSFSTFFKVALFNYSSYLFFTHGIPKWNAGYGQRLVLDPAVQSFFYCVVFWVSAPYGLAMVPVFLLEMVHFVSYLSNLLMVLKLSNAGIVETLTANALVPLTSRLISEPSFVTLPTATKWARLYQRMPQVTANIEVAIGIALLLELLTPARNFLLVMLYWQLLRVRYMISPPLQEAFTHVNAAILSVTTHSKCPAVIGKVYAKIQNAAKSMTDLQAQANGGGMKPRCSIM